MPNPTSIPADGNVKVAFCTTLSAPNAPVVTQVTAGTDVTTYLTGSGLAYSTEQAPIDDTRLSDTDETERPGRTRVGLELTYVYQAQGSPTDNDAYDDLAEDATGFIVIRFGPAHTTAFAAAQVVDVIPVICGVQRKMPPEANSTLKVMQKLFVTGPSFRDAVIAA